MVLNCFLFHGNGKLTVLNTGCESNYMVIEAFISVPQISLFIFFQDDLVTNRAI